MMQFQMWYIILNVFERWWLLELISNKYRSRRPIKTRESGAVLTYALKLIRACIGFAFLWALIGLKNSLQQFNQSDEKLTSNRDLVTRNFPRSDCLLWFLWFWF